MIYCPSQEDHHLLGVLALPVPRSLLTFLFKRGLGIWVIPPGEVGFEFIYERLGIEYKVHEPDKRWPHTFNAYYPKEKRIILHGWALRQQNSNVVLHELGHAFDYLMFYENCISEFPLSKKALRYTKPLDNHTIVQDKFHGRMAEHFATCFEAYFSEPGNKDNPDRPNINQLHRKTVKFYQQILAPFYDEDRKQEQAKKKRAARLLGH